jgi:pSer/pThr/pTyr-binding forkhead associated (FHA) protein
MEDLRGHLRGPGAYLGYRTEGGAYRAARLREGSTRIGRSDSAQVRFDDPTVSRRHALVVRQADGVHILDDRSLNGVFVNGERVEWRLLNDGDEIVVGRHRLDFIELTNASLKLVELARRGRTASIS